MSKAPFTFKTKSPSNGHPAANLPAPQTAEQFLRSIPAERWPAERARIAVQNARQAQGDLPANQLASPIIIPQGVDAKGQQQIALHTGFRMRDRAALDLLAASVCARIVQKGVLGALTAIPGTPQEMTEMVRLAFQMAEIFVQQAHALAEQDFETLKGRIEDRMDEEYAAAHAPTRHEGSVRIRVTEE